MSTNESIYIYREIITDKKKINIIFLIVVENINKIKHSDVYYLFLVVVLVLLVVVIF